MQPDISQLEMDEIADTVMDLNIDGMIISNTTIERPESLKTRNKELLNQTGMKHRMMKIIIIVI